MMGINLSPDKLAFCAGVKGVVTVSFSPTTIFSVTGPPYIGASELKGALFFIILSNACLPSVLFLFVVGVVLPISLSI